MFSKNDETKLKQIGYTIIAEETKHGLVSFMRLVFPNFDLLALLDKVEMYFTPTSSTPVHRVIEFNGSSKSLKVVYHNNHKNEDDALVFVRTFIRNGMFIEVSHDYCILPKVHRGKGLVKPVFQESLKQYDNMGAGKISVHAGLSGGGYVWAKHGFVGIHKNEVDVILNKAFSELNANDYDKIKRIYDVYYSRNPQGQAFPMELWAGFDFMKRILMGSDWHGELDLKNESQMSKFVEYVYR